MFVSVLYQTSNCLDPHQKKGLDWYHQTSLSPPVFLLTIPRRCFCGSFLLFMFVSVCCLSVHCSPVVTCWERSGLFALLYVIFSCVFITFLCGVLGRMWLLNIVDSWYLPSSLHGEPEPNYICKQNSPDQTNTRGAVFVCLFLYVPSTIFQLNRDGSSWVEPVLS